jgi:aspartyl-tRNA(Asn)/glutamyl-tRNA(Gln) amidotransferase subunit A
MRVSTSKEGLPINVQIAGTWQAESTILHVAARLEAVSPVRNLRPAL